MAAVGLVLTFSTSAWIGFLVAAIAVALIGAANGRWSGLSRLGVIGGGALLLVFNVTLIQNLLTTRFSARLFGEVSEVSRQKDLFMLNAFSENPIDVVWGYGAGGADLQAIPFVPAEELLYRRTPTAGTVGMRLLGDFGLLGVLGFGALVVASAVHVRRRQDLEGYAFLLSSWLAVQFMGAVSLSVFLFLAGAYLAQARDVRLFLRRAPQLPPARDQSPGE